MLRGIRIHKIALSTYMILYSHPLYDRLAPMLSAFERQVPRAERADGEGEPPQVIVFGAGRHGGAIMQGLQRSGIRVLGVDYDPQAVSEGRLGVPLLYGDAEDPELPGTLPLKGVDWVVSAVPGRDANVALLGALRSHGYTGCVMLTARDENDARAVQEAGADEIIRPYLEAAERAVRIMAGTCAPAGASPAGAEDVRA